MPETEFAKEFLNIFLKNPLDFLFEDLSVISLTIKNYQKMQKTILLNIFFRNICRYHLINLLPLTA